MRHFFKAVTAFLFVIFLTNCTHNQTDIDTSKVELKPIEFKRLDKAFSISNQMQDIHFR